MFDPCTEISLRSSALISQISNSYTCAKMLTATQVKLISALPFLLSWNRLNQTIEVQKNITRSSQVKTKY